MNSANVKSGSSASCFRFFGFVKTFCFFISGVGKGGLEAGEADAGLEVLHIDNSLDKSFFGDFSDHFKELFQQDLVVVRILSKPVNGFEHKVLPDLHKRKKYIVAGDVVATH